MSSHSLVRAGMESFEWVGLDTERSVCKRKHHVTICNIIIMHRLCIDINYAWYEKGGAETLADRCSNAPNKQILLLLLAKEFC